ncbi:MAG: hypothetical protein PUC63_02695 [Clostridiales bacterium]|nr:hypothetical protein [Clostridiales bacterium]
MESTQRWNKKIFSLLLEKAKGDRSWRQFAFDSGISYVQMRKLSGMTQENPPRPKLIKKIALAAWNDIDLEDLLYAAGIFPPDTRKKVKRQKSDTFLDRFRALTPKGRSSVEDYIAFIADRESERMSEKQSKQNKD